MHSTPVSLLERLRQPGEQVAWERFVQLYTPLLCHWARRLGVAEADIADLVQDVFALLIRKLPRFTYDRHKRFRGWLWTLFRNKWREKQRRQPMALSHADQAVMSSLASPDDAEVVMEAEYRQYLTQRALQLMQAEFQPITWKAFWEYVVADRPAAEVARDLGITENAVYLAKGRVLGRLRHELAGLLE